MDIHDVAFEFKPTIRLKADGYCGKDCQYGRFRLGDGTTRFKSERCLLFLEPIKFDEKLGFKACPTCEKVCNQLTMMESM
jgi:hypothetical protein